MPITMQPVNSRSLRAVGYDADAQVLRVEYQNGGVYEAEGVPAHVHEQLVNAQSIGKAMNALKTQHSFRKVSHAKA